LTILDYLLQLYAEVLLSCLRYKLEPK